MTDVTTAGAVGGRAAELELDEYRGQLTGYCYRMLGSAFDAEDAVQETMVRAWRGLERFEGRAALRSWLYRIATNVCLDMLSSRQRRARPMDLTSAPWEPVESSLAGRRPENTWLEPMVDSKVLPTAGDPADVAVARDSIRLAFVAALQHLPPRQRAVLILRDVLRWKADEVADLLDSSVASVNSALQRARASLGSREEAASGPTDPLDDEHRELLARYVDAFERYDMEALVTLLHEDATQNMPPYEMWLQGRDHVLGWMVGPGHGCRGSRVIPMEVNGSPSFAQYRPSGPGGRHEPWGIHVLDVSDGRVAGVTTFLDTRLFALFGLSEHPDGDHLHG
ncbi:MAG TPA: sigma-70 family RNA polymerase sigma factor [Jiangellales bacterium]|nr:sigma-70 family RNA polymerase sigma factor [Jiangellales bacterium]